MSPRLRVVLTSRPGGRRNPVTGQWQEGHSGVDLAVPQGTAIVAIWPGTVQAVYLDHDLNGSAVVIDHSSAGIPYRSSYVHLSALATPGGWITGAIPAAQAQALAKSWRGASVLQGQLLGLSGGEPGTWGAGRSTGPHLHLSLRDQAGAIVDPLRWIDWTRTPGLSLVER